MLGKITITNKSERTTEIDIEGIIGIPEEWQFDKEEQQVATYKKFRETLNSISEIETRNIIVNIRSTGGNVNDALLIYEALSALDTQITTRCYGYVASAATIIAQAASKGCREISKNALYLIHKSSSSTEGNANDLTQTAELLEQTDTRIASIYAERSGKDAENFSVLMSENMGNGRWLSPEEVLEMGLADRHIEASGIRKQWNSFLRFIGLDHEKEQYFSEERPAQNSVEAETDVEKLEKAIERYRNPDDTEQHQTDETIKNLQNKISELETQNAKLRAKATQTFPKEDPSTRDVRRSVNAEAYEGDMRSIKSTL